MIREKTESDQNKIISDFNGIIVQNGRYGPYITSDKKNYRIPKGTDASKLSREDCLKIIETSEKTKKSS